MVTAKISTELGEKIKTATKPCKYGSDPSYIQAMKIAKARAGHQMDSAPRDPPPARTQMRARDVTPGDDPHRIEAARPAQFQAKASAAKLGTQSMTWIARVLLLAGGLAAAATALSYAFGFGWYSLLIAGLPTFVASSVVVPSVLVVREQRVALKKRLLRGTRTRKPRGRVSRPAPAVSSEAQAPSAECGGRVLAALPAAPL